MIGPENLPSLEIQISRKSYEELRRHPRLYAPIPLKYQVSHVESGESWSGEGTLQNISLGGVYFTCKTPLPIEPSQIHNFSIATAASPDKLDKATRLSARGLVVRVERPTPGEAACGIAVKFLTPLQLALA
ncbi:MAG: PilZ domain-containing protein [Deltaproteobacteria bacterium]|nr:PilZ domain-containing protein [Deltaproteobacteria bacterium]